MATLLSRIGVQSIILAVLPPVLRAYATRIRESPLGYRLVRGAFWSAAGAVIARGLGIVSSIVVARVLGKVGFGELAIINSTTMMFELFACFGLGVTATKYVAEHRDTDPLKTGRIIGVAWLITAITGSLTGASLAVLAPWLAAHTLAAPHLGGLLRITGIALFITALNAAQSGALAGFEAFKTIASRNMIAGLLNFPIMIAGVFLAGLQGAVWATVVSCAVNWFLCHLAVRSEARRFGVPLTFSGCLQELPLLWRFSLPAVFSGMMVVPVNWVCNALLVNQANGYAEMGLLQAANQWRNLVLFLPQLLLGPVLPILSSSQGSASESTSFQKTMSVTQGFIVVVTFPVAVACMFFSDYLMRIYWKTQSDESVPLIGCMLAALIQGLGGAIGPALSAMGRMWLGFMLNLVWGVLYIVIVACCAARMGAAAVTFGQAIAYAFLASLTFLCLRHNLPKGMLVRFFLGLGLAGLLTILALLAPGVWRTWLGIPIVIGVSVCGVRWFLGSEIRAVFRPGRPCIDQETVSPHP